MQIQTAGVGEQHSRRAADTRQNDEHQRLVFEQKFEIVSERRRIFGGDVSFRRILKSEEEKRNCDNTANNRNYEIDPFEHFAFCHGIQTFGHIVSDDRSDDGDDTCACRAEQTRDCKQIASAIGVVAHCGGKSPIRNVGNRIYHAPNDVHNRDCGKTAVALGIPRQETDCRHDCNRERHPLHIRTAFAPLRTSAVNDRTHDRIVESVENTRAEHKECDGKCVESDCVRHKDGQIRTDDRANEVLSETAKRITETFLWLHLAVTGSGTEKFVSKRVDFLFCAHLLSCLRIFTHNFTL